MPIYEYRCTSCEREFEYEQRMSDAPRSECEACGGRLERLISRTSFHLKGSGWYKDLYSSAKPDKDKDKGKDKDKDKDAGKSDAPSSSGSGESSGPADASPAPAAKADSAPKKATAE